MSSAFTAKNSANVPTMVRRGSPYTSSPTWNPVTGTADLRHRAREVEPQHDAACGSR